MDFDLQARTPHDLATAAMQFEKNGFLLLHGVPEIPASWIDLLKPFLVRLLGPFVHVTAAETRATADRPALHQDFCASECLTSPNGLTLWLPGGGDGGDFLRLYPASHRLGFLCQRGIDLDDPRLVSLGDPVDIPARKGCAVLCHGLLLHGTSRHGFAVRFFPLCGFLRSEVDRLDWFPEAALLAGLASAPGPILRAPLLEARAWLGGRACLKNLPPLSILHWVNFVARGMRGAEKGAKLALQQLINREQGFDPPQVFLRRFADFPIHWPTLACARKGLRRAPAPAA